MNFGRDTVLSKSPKLVNFGLSSFNKTDELGSIFVPTTRIGRLTEGYNWLLPGHDISGATADIVIGMEAKNHYNFKSEFETRRDKF